MSSSDTVARANPSSRVNKLYHLTKSPTCPLQLAPRRLAGSLLWWWLDDNNKSTGGMFNYHLSHSADFVWNVPPIDQQQSRLLSIAGEYYLWCLGSCCFFANRWFGPGGDNEIQISIGSGARGAFFRSMTTRVF